MDNKTRTLEEAGGNETTKERREFLKKAGKFGITAPMAALLLSVGSKRASAQDNGYHPPTYTPTSQT